MASPISPASQTPLALEITRTQPIMADWNAGLYPHRPPEFFALELCGETGELANKEKKLWRGQSIPPAELAEEAADVLITLLNYCNARGIDLGAAFDAKVRVVEGRRRGKAIGEP
jgi:NTP pyrophosphatase (non-canonical NTP hydrolase)